VIASWRRIVVMVVVVALTVGALVADRHRPSAAAAEFGSLVAPVMPVAPADETLTTAWYCPGVPAVAEGDSPPRGAFVVLNPTDRQLKGTASLVPSTLVVGGAPTKVPLDIAPRSSQTIQPHQVAPAPFTAALIEMAGSGGLVEQTLTSLDGVSESACATAPSTTWYFADDTTTVDASLSLLVFNPFPDDAVIDLTFATEEGAASPLKLQDYVVPAGTMRVITNDDLPKRNTMLATSLVARGRVILGRYQTMKANRRGLVSGLASPQADSQWWFPRGEKGNGRNERIVVYNPGQDQAQVDVAFYPADPSQAVIEPLSLDLAGGQASVVDVETIPTVPNGLHSIVVRAPDDRPVVAERSFEITGGDSSATTGTLGSPLAAPRWWFPAPAPGGGAILSVLNPTGNPVNVTVASVGPGGLTPLKGLEKVALGAGVVQAFDLGAAGGSAVPIAVDADGAVVAERLVLAPSGRRGAAFAFGIPALGS
jgi:Family of unknown function (DUF5719)